VKNSPFFLYFSTKVIEIFIKQPFKRVKGLILGLPLGEISIAENVASNQTPPNNPNIFFEKLLCPLPPGLMSSWNNPATPTPPPSPKLKQLTVQKLYSQRNQILTHTMFSQNCLT
jgi:hypothetical protein